MFINNDLFLPFKMLMNVQNLTRMIAVLMPYVLMSSEVMPAFVLRAIQEMGFHVMVRNIQDWRIFLEFTYGMLTGLDFRLIPHISSSHVVLFHTSM